MEIRKKLLDEISLETLMRDNNLRLVVREYIDSDKSRLNKKEVVYYLAYLESKDEKVWIKGDASCARGNSENDAINSLIQSLSGQQLEIEMAVPRLKMEGKEDGK